MLGPLLSLDLPQGLSMAPEILLSPRSPLLGLVQGIIPGVVDGTVHMQDLEDTHKPH